MLKTISNLFVKREPADLPGALVPGEIIRRYSLLNRLPEVIGFDLRYLTEDKLQPTEIGVLQALDGTEFSGQAVIHKNFAVTTEKGLDVDDCPYWVVNIFAQHVSMDFMQDLCDRLAKTYGAPTIGVGVGHYNSHDVKKSASNKACNLKGWQELKLQPDWRLQHCRCYLQSYEYGKIINLHYYIYES